MGFHRKGQPVASNRVPANVAVARFVGEQEIAQVMRAQDPFGIDDPCPMSPAGHQAHGSCGMVVCVHCAKVYWS